MVPKNLTVDQSHNSWRRALPSLRVFSFAEYIARPAATHQAGSLISSGQASMPIGRPLRVGQFTTRSAMSHIPFSSAPPPVSTSPSSSACSIPTFAISLRTYRNSSSARASRISFSSRRGASRERRPSSEGTSINVLSEVKPRIAQPYSCFRFSASSI